MRARNWSTRSAGGCVGDDVGDQALVPGRVLARDHRDLADRGVLGDAGFDFAQLDAKAADLHLLVDAPEVLDVAVREAARQIAGAVQARRRLATNGSGTKRCAVSSGRLR